MTDEKLALLELVTYIDVNVLKAANIERTLLPLQKKYSVYDNLKIFDETSLDSLREEHGDEIIEGALITGNEWANIIETIKNDPELRQLLVHDFFVYKQPNDKEVNLQIAYENPDTREGIVTFKGTSGREEWEDNVHGLHLSDTPCQQRALEFFDKQAEVFDELTVVGHSKGSNKAMYITIVSEHANKISKCVGIDGQGFSNDFLDKYSDQIRENGSKITNYYVSSDFVNILMKQVDNSKQISCKGYEMTNALQAHSPDSVFERDNSGNLLIKDNNPSFVQLEDRDEKMKTIQGFVAYLMDNNQNEKLTRMGNYLAPIIGASLGGAKEDNRPSFIQKSEKFVGTLGLALKDPVASLQIAGAVLGYTVKEKILPAI